jgi:hypothetical protein
MYIIRKFLNAVFAKWLAWLANVSFFVIIIMSYTIFIQDHATRITTYLYMPPNLKR